MFALMEKLEIAKRFLMTMHRLGILTERERQVIYTQTHSQIMEKLRNP
jgi:hypothetical protein